MSRAHLSFLARYDVPPEVLFRVATDHEGMSRWVGAPVSVIAAPKDGGVGTVRRITAGPLRIDEEVVAWDPPRRMIYRVVRGLPLRYHRGELRVSPWGDGRSQLAWEITIASSAPFVAEGIARVLERTINTGLKKLGDVLTEE